jgi:hypothetical protein
MVYTEELHRLHVGQSLDLYWTSQVTCPSISEYIGMIDNSKFKVVANVERRSNTSPETGGLFRMLSRMLEVESDVPS